MRRLLSIVTALVVGCSGGQLSDAGHSSKKSATPDSEEETQSADKPVQVSGSFLTFDCGRSSDELADVASGDEVIGCAIIDANTKRKFTKQQVAIVAVTMAFSDGGTSKLKLHPAAKSSAWHVLTSLPQGRIDQATAIAMRGAVGSSPLYLPTSRPRTYNLEKKQEAPPPAVASATITILPSDLPDETPPIVIDADPQTTTADTSTATSTATGTSMSTDVTVTSTDTLTGTQGTVPVTVTDCHANHETTQGFVTGAPVIPCSWATDNDPGKVWNAGVGATDAQSVWLWLDLGQGKTIHKVTMAISFLTSDPDTSTYTALVAGNGDPAQLGFKNNKDLAPGEVELKHFDSGTTADGDSYTWMGEATNVRYLRVITSHDKSYVAWKDINVFE